MNLEKFNSQLLQLNNSAIQLLETKKILDSYTSKQLLLHFLSLDAKGQGFFTYIQLLDIFPSTSPFWNIENLQKLTPSKKLSFTYLMGLLLRNHPNSKQNQIMVEVDKKEVHHLIGDCLHKIIESQMIKQNVSRNFDKYIPYRFARPSAKELEEYLILQNIEVDCKVISRIMKLPQEEHEEQLITDAKIINDPEIQSLSKIMQRIKIRVNDFGKEWIQKQQ